MLMYSRALSNGSNQGAAVAPQLDSWLGGTSHSVSPSNSLSELSTPSTATAATEQVLVEPAQPSSSNQIIGVDSYDTVGRWGIVVLFAVALWMKLSGKQTKQ